MKLIHDEPPRLLVKYCKKTDFENFFRKGLFRLRTHKYYREEYETHGAGFGDPNDGLEHHQLPKHRVTVEIPSFIYCMAKSWSPETQLLWRQRPKCDYDFAFEVKGAEFLKAMRDAVYYKYDDRAMIFLGSVDYNSTTIFGQQVVSGDLKKHGFKKDPPFVLEDEYRLIVRDRSEPSYGRLLQLEIENVGDFLAGAYIVTEFGECKKFTL